jgi:hypothetical protein
MNVLYIGPYRQKDEWGSSSMAFAQLLSNQKEINLVTRPIWFNNQFDYKDVGKLEELEFKNVEKPEVLIQYGLPSYLNYNGSFDKNIAITKVDCRVDNMDWKSHLDLFDSIIVFSEYEKDLLKKSGVKTDVKNFNFPPIQEYESVNIDFLNDFKRSFCFYTNGSLEEKSGLRETIASFLSSFTINDNVVLIVFCSKTDEIEEYVKQVKTSLGIFSNLAMYPDIIICKGDDNTINYAHENFECYIDVEYNSRVSQNVLKALSKERTVIMLDTCSSLIKDYPFYVESVEEICLVKQRPINHLYSGEFYWKKPIMKSLKEKMRQVLKSDASEKNQIIDFKSQIQQEPNQKIREILCIQ